MFGILTIYVCIPPHVIQPIRSSPHPPIISHYICVYIATLAMMKQCLSTFLAVSKTPEVAAADPGEAARGRQDHWHPVWFWWSCLSLDYWTVRQGEYKLHVNECISNNQMTLISGAIVCVRICCLSIVRVTSFSLIMSTPSWTCCGFVQTRRRMWRLQWESATQWKTPDPLNLSSVWSGNHSFMCTRWIPSTIWTPYQWVKFFFLM